MSTKITIDHADGHHLDVDIFQPGVISLHQEGVDFVARPDSLTITIPVPLWDRLRGHGVQPGLFWDDEAEQPDPTPLISPGTEEA